MLDSLFTSCLPYPAKSLLAGLMHSKDSIYLTTIFLFIFQFNIPSCWIETLLYNYRTVAIDLWHANITFTKLSSLYFGCRADMNKESSYICGIPCKSGTQLPSPYMSGTQKHTPQQKPPTHKIHPFPILKLAVFSTACYNIVSKLQKPL